MSIHCQYRSSEQSLTVGGFWWRREIVRTSGIAKTRLPNAVGEAVPSSGLEVVRKRRRVLVEWRVRCRLTRVLGRVTESSIGLCDVVCVPFEVVSSVMDIMALIYLFYSGGRSMRTFVGRGCRYGVMKWGHNRRKSWDSRRHFICAAPTPSSLFCSLGVALLTSIACSQWANFIMPGETAESPNGERPSQEVDPLSDPEERRVLYAALDAFR